MRARLSAKLLILLFLAWSMPAGCGRLSNASPAGQARPSGRILFIGNSYTSFNGGIDKQLKGLAPAIKTTSITAGGFTLEDHWNDGRALRAIRAGGWDYVVLQEQSQTPIFDRGKFFEFAGKFDTEIRNSGAKTILLMTWQRPDSSAMGVNTPNLAAAYNDLGATLGAKVVPAGAAFDRALKARPDLDLYGVDGHPTIEGTYLAACVLYATIFERSPAGNIYSDRSIPADVKAYLQRIAAVTAGY